MRHPCLLLMEEVFYITESRVVIRMNHFYYVVEWNPTSSIIAMLDLSKNTTAYKAASISKES